MTTTEIIEGTAVEIVPAEVRAVAVVQQPGQALVNVADDPAAMVAVAARLATVLRDIVDRQKLYQVIQGKSYPLVEAWQTIGRLDNVVAREARPPIRHDDGSYEAFAELIRLSDGMVIGSASALCGSPDDEPWGGTAAKYGKEAKPPRPENNRRSMAATRAISRAFRGQYAWIMALAGYEPTPAEEMPHSPDGSPSPSPAPGAPRQVTPPLSGPIEAAPPYRDLSENGPWEGAATKGQPPTDGALRETPTGSVFGFVVMEPIEGRANPRKLQVIVEGDLAHAINVAWLSGKPDEATVWGDLWLVPWVKDGKQMPPYRRIVATRVMTPEWTLPAADAPVPAPTSDKVDDLSELPW